MNKHSIFLIILTIIAFSMCNDSADERLPFSESIQEIRYGTSFGMCIGYCKHEFTFSENRIDLERSSWGESIPTQRFYHELPTIQADSISMFVNQTTFKQLENVIGCPDCADGGAEWVQIIFSDYSIHKVTFEYYHEPESIQPLVQLLRSMTQRYMAEMIE